MSYENTIERILMGHGFSRALHIAIYLEHYALVKYE